MPDSRSALLDWYGRERRDLPWRHRPDAYAIWVAEIMLQQTQVATVVPYFERFLARFPDLPTLAAADEDEVLRHWSGLGYYRRARALHAAARRVVIDHAGQLPADPVALRALPGVGRYTAGAIASVAFGLMEPVVDGNVRRVLARLHAVDAHAVGRAEEQRRLWRHAAELVRGPRPGDLNQALMELGALICTPREPRCPHCPLAGECAARRKGEPRRYPATWKRRPAIDVRVGVALVARAGRLLLERRTSGNPLRGSWEFPAFELAARADAAGAIGCELSRRHGLDVGSATRLGGTRHAIMNRRLALEAWRFSLRRGAVAGNPALRWQRLDELDALPVSAATRKLARLFELPPHEAPRV